MFLLTYSYNSVQSAGFLNEEKSGIIPASEVLQGASNIDMIDIIKIFNNFNLKELKNTINTYKDAISLTKLKFYLPFPSLKEILFVWVKTI